MNYRVVLADDEPEVLRSIQRTLDWEKYGFSVVGAFLNGLDVLEFLENHDVESCLPISGCPLWTESN